MFVIRYATTEETALEEELPQGKEGFLTCNNFIQTFPNKKAAMKKCEEMRKLFLDASYSIFKLLPIKG